MRTPNLPAIRVRRSAWNKIVGQKRPILPKHVGAIRVRLEIADRTRMCLALYPVLLDLKNSGALAPQAVANVVEACAEGYPFPANLDIDSPLTGMAPPSQQDLMRQALGEHWPAEEFSRAIEEQQARKRSH